MKEEMMENYFLIGHLPITGEQYLLGPFDVNQAQEKILELGDDLGVVIKGRAIDPEDLF